jgi:hypothetical protein
VWLVAIVMASWVQAQSEIFSDGFETGDSCEWSRTVTLDLCDGLDNDCDLDVDEDANCDDNLDCTQDQCVSGSCQHSLVVGCLIDDVCIADGDLNPLNSCQTCDSTVSFDDWTPVADGRPCGDLVCNECTSGFCTDSAIGVAGPGCDDVTASDCDAPDTCALGGICDPNYGSPGTLCGAGLVEPICNPDACDGAGLCVDAPTAPSGTPCGDSSSTDCDSPDTCGAGGVCDPNYRAQGTLCGAGIGEPICNPDACDGSGSCSDVPAAPNGTPCGGLVCEECASGMCEPFSVCGDGFVCPITEFCDDGNTDDCGTCNADCSGSGLGPTCPSGTGCVSGLDCLSGVCTGGICS